MPCFCLTGAARNDVGEMKARVRVYLLTYRRAELLRRALHSLLIQTATDWVCELHNDAPGDDLPRKILSELAPGDPRFVYHPHRHNWGAMTTFNHAFAGGPEPLAAILEDDNWWEPVFLERMLAVMAARPEAEIAWANMRCWQEMPDGGWHDTGNTIWPVIDCPHLTIAWPQLLQFDGPLHSNGAMLVRSRVGKRLQVPLSVPLSHMENLRERAFRSPLVLVPEVLANFSLTLETARPSGRAHWARVQAMMGAAFLRHIPLSPDEQSRLWEARRAAHPPATAGLFFAGLLQPTPGWWRHATSGDWWRFLRGCARRPLAALAALRSRRSNPELWREIDRATAAACTRPQDAADIGRGRIASRSDLTAAAPGGDPGKDRAVPPPPASRC